MSWIVVVLMFCAGDQCKIGQAEVALVPVAVEETLRAKCAGASNCAEPRKGFFILKESSEPTTPMSRQQKPPQAA